LSETDSERGKVVERKGKVKKKRAGKGRKEWDWDWGAFACLVSIVGDVGLLSGEPMSHILSY
jgi:hypothetical protein